MTYLPVFREINQLKLATRRSELGQADSTRLAVDTTSVCGQRSGSTGLQILTT